MSKSLQNTGFLACLIYTCIEAACTCCLVPGILRIKLHASPKLRLAVAKELSLVKGTSVQEILERTTANMRSFFNLAGEINSKYVLYFYSKSKFIFYRN